MKLIISDILKATGGALLCGDENTAVQSFFLDSREAKAGGMFIPMRGEKIDSHQFIDEVLEAGAVASFTEIPLPKQNRPLIFVPDSRIALQKSAAYYRDQFDIPIVGITGSAGKTTAKEMIALALSSHLKTLKTAGNQNSQIGVPLTVCRLKKEHQAAVIEMGISVPKEMQRLVEVVKPQYAVITNIGVSHIEFLKSRENIMAEKLHISDYISAGGAIFVNGDDDLLSTLKSHAYIKQRVVTFGVSKGCDWRASSIKQVSNGIFFTCEYYGKCMEVFLPAVGVHNIRNALASLAVSNMLDIDLEGAVRALSTYSPPAMRQQILQLPDDITLIDDSYNASPESMHGALDILTSLQPASRTIAVLGDMLELGNYSEGAHLEIGEYASKKHVSFLIGVGEFAPQLCKGFGINNSLCVPTAKEALKALSSILKPGDTVLIKASRGIGLDTLSKALL